MQVCWFVYFSRKTVKFTYNFANSKSCMSIKCLWVSTILLEYSLFIIIIFIKKITFKNLLACFSFFYALFSTYTMYVYSAQHNTKLVRLIKVGAFIMKKTLIILCGLIKLGGFVMKLRAVLSAELWQLTCRPHPGLRSKWTNTRATSYIPSPLIWLKNMCTAN